MNIVAESIRKYGVCQPIVVDADDVIVAGHVRYRAATQLGLTEYPVIRCTHLTPEQVRAYRIADNKCREKSDWDKTKLQLELLAIKEMGETLVSIDLFAVVNIPMPDDDESEGGDFTPESFELVIHCNNRAQQKLVYENVVSRGKECRVISTT